LAEFNPDADIERGGLGRTASIFLVALDDRERLCL
jgi:hypothetical protein